MFTSRFRRSTSFSVGKHHLRKYQTKMIMMMIMKILTVDFVAFMQCSVISYIAFWNGSMFWIVFTLFRVAKFTSLLKFLVPSVKKHLAICANKNLIWFELVMFTSRGWCIASKRISENSKEVSLSNTSTSLSTLSLFLQTLFHFSLFRSLVFTFSFLFFAVFLSLERPRRPKILCHALSLVCHRNCHSDIRIR